MKQRLLLGIIVCSALALSAGLVGCVGGAGSSESHVEGDTVKANEAPKGASAHGTSTTGPMGGSGAGSSKAQSSKPDAQ